MFRVFFLASLLISSAAQAQQFKVEKVKGNKAVIEFLGPPLFQGRTYSVGSALNESTEGSVRRYVLGGSLDFHNITRKYSNLSGVEKDNVLHVTARFGWNLGSFEVGPLVGYTNSDSFRNLPSKYTLISFGAFTDYNLTPNTLEAGSLYGVGGELSYGHQSLENNNSVSVLSLFASGFGKWFVFGPSTALRLDLGYSYQTESGGTTTATSQGFAFRGGVVTYF